MYLNKKGFSLVEMSIATLVLTIGLLGVAGMQTRALNGTLLSTAHSTGSGVAMAWAEWLNGLVSTNNKSQQQISYFGSTSLYPENFVHLASFDGNANDAVPVTVILPVAIDDIVKCFNGKEDFTVISGADRGTANVTFVKEGGAPFTASDMPPPPPPGSRVVLTINANIPVKYMATVTVSVPYYNAFTNVNVPIQDIFSAKTGAPLSFVIAANM